MMTGCTSSTNHSQPVLIDECKAIAKDEIASPDKSNLESPETPVVYTQTQITKGVSRSEVVDNQTKNNALWEKDRQKLMALQAYIKTLQDAGIISK